MTVELVVIGGGKMGEALVSGLLAASWAPPEQILVIEASPARRRALTDDGGLAARYPGLTIVAPDAVEGTTARGVVLAVKPDDAAAACILADQLKVERLLSVAAGVTISALTAALSAAAARRTASAARVTDPPGGEDAVGAVAPVVLRAMPNTPALVGAGAAALAGGPEANDDDLDWAESVLAAVGVVVRVEEAALDAVTGLSGSGPAYVFLLAEALIDGGVYVGLARPVASQLAIQTLLGAARMLAETGESAEALRAAVTSPAGTTAAGLRALESAAFRAAVIDAVAAATSRSRELGA
jgi:pyrroline-5-carboxylate reductase